jgi:hypothetical protein
MIREPGAMATSRSRLPRNSRQAWRLGFTTEFALLAINRYTRRWARTRQWLVTRLYNFFSRRGGVS